MFDKFFKEGKSKDIIIKLITIAVIAAVLLVAFDVLTPGQGQPQTDNR